MTQLDSSRRQFLRATALGAAAMPVASGQNAPPLAGPAAPLPRVKFRDAEITRLIVGSNPLYGYSHFNWIYDRCMQEWMTPERRIETLLRAEAAGINTWQLHYNETPADDFRRYREAGGKMNVLLLADFALMKDWSLMPRVAREMKPIGIAHHGGRTDDRFRKGEMNVVQDFTKAVHDAGVPAGVSTHNPAVVDYIEQRDWKIDYYMTCLYRVSRTPEEARQDFGESPLPEIFMERDRERMTAMVRKTKRTCFAFKLLGAGRNVGDAAEVEAAFRYAFENIKPQDAAIVGMWPKFKDEPRENAGIVRRILERT